MTPRDFVIRCPECGQVIGLAIGERQRSLGFATRYLEAGFTVERLDEKASRAIPRENWIHKPGCSMADAMVREE